MAITLKLMPALSLLTFSQNFYVHNAVFMDRSRFYSTVQLFLFYKNIRIPRFIVKMLSKFSFLHLQLQKLSFPIQQKSHHSHEIPRNYIFNTVLRNYICKNYGTVLPSQLSFSNTVLCFCSQFRSVAQRIRYFPATTKHNRGIILVLSIILPLVIPTLP